MLPAPAMKRLTFSSFAWHAFRIADRMPRLARAPHAHLHDHTHKEKAMRRTMMAAVAALALSTGAALASDKNWNAGSASNTQNDGRANCHSSTMRDGCAASEVTEAPLPLPGQGALGVLLVCIAGLTAFELHRRAEKAQSTVSR